MVKKIVFSEHALEQLKQRKISKKSIKDTIKSPENKIKSFRGRELRQKGFGDKILEVVIYEDEDLINVVTGYFLEEEDQTNEDKIR